MLRSVARAHGFFASFVHLFSLYYRASKVEYVEFAKTVAQCEPSAPDGVDAMVKWYPLFAHERKREQERCDRAFKQMAQRLTKIQDAVRNLSVHLPRINELEQKNASMESDLDSATTELQRLKEEVRDKDRIIQDLSDRSSSSSSVERISSDKHNSIWVPSDSSNIKSKVISCPFSFLCVENSPSLLTINFVIGMSAFLRNATFFDKSDLDKAALSFKISL